MTLRQNARTIQTALALAMALSAPAASWAGVADAYYERAFVMAADRRCDLFEPRVKAALTAATLQAQGAARRAGVSVADLAATRARAERRAGSTACGHTDLAVVRRRVDQAYAGWARTPRMTFAGIAKAWRADRYDSRAVGWRLVQSSTFGASVASFGSTAHREAPLTAVVSFAGRPRPYAARLTMRDPARTPRPWLAAPGSMPAGLQASVWSTGSSIADKGLVEPGRRGGEAWTFPASTARRLASLDPRESFAIEFHFRDGTVATARFEVGDFAAARAFVAMGPA